MKEHCTQKHSAKLNAYQGMLHRDKIGELKRGCHFNQIFKNKVKFKWSLIKANYVIANLTSKRSKPFPDDKQCIENVTYIKCPDKKENNNNKKI